MTILLLLVSLGILAVVLQDAFEVMLLPRRVSRRLRLMRLFFRASWAIWRALGHRWTDKARRERLLSVFGPLSMVLLFALWGMLLILAFGAIEWVLQLDAGLSKPPALVEQIYMSGVTFFTLGYGDVVPHTTASRIVAVIEAGTGIGFIAVVIGYLPVLYQLFSRREAHVIQLDARAGSPPTATTLLVRHAESGGLDRLEELLRAWEAYGAELLESHLSYPMLAYYRSQHDDQSWLAALAAVMDTCALILVGVEAVPAFQARMTFAMTRQVLVEMDRSLVIGASPPGPERLPMERFAQLDRWLAQAPLSWTGGQDAAVTLAAVRATYEPLLARLSSYLLLPLPGWMPENWSTDHWESGPRGLVAKRLIEQLATRPTDTKPGRRRRSRERPSP